MIKKLLSIAICFTSTFVVFAQQTYYNDVDLTKTGLELKSELATKITNTHTKFLRYTPEVWDASKVTDVNPDDSSEIILIYGYTDDTSDTAKTDDINDQNSGGSNGWNREHVFPKSLGNPRFENNDTPGSDAHHLRPSDVQYNNLRGSRPFAEGSGNSGVLASGNWYPGDEWRGDVARMMMYMYLRYGSRCLPSTVGIGSNAGTPDDMIDLFLKWNAEDPVSTIEDARNTYHENTSNSAAQGNRNPFIDNPNLATQIWGGPTAQNRWATAGVEEDELASKISIFPNPSKNSTITVSTNGDLNITKITMYSILGKEIISDNNPVFSNRNFTVNNLTSGIYLLNITNDKTTIAKKIIVN